jgi:hypothetical protein
MSTRPGAKGDDFQREIWADLEVERMRAPRKESRFDALSVVCWLSIGVGGTVAVLLSYAVTAVVLGLSHRLGIGS